MISDCEISTKYILVFVMKYEKYCYGKLTDFKKIETMHKSKPKNFQMILPADVTFYLEMTNDDEIEVCSSLLFERLSNFTIKHCECQNLTLTWSLKTITSGQNNKWTKPFQLWREGKDDKWKKERKCFPHLSIQAVKTWKKGCHVQDHQAELELFWSWRLELPKARPQSLGQEQDLRTSMRRRCRLQVSSSPTLTTPASQ